MTTNKARRHHFIPKLLLKGFASRVIDKKHFVYQFRRDLEPRELSIVDVGVEKHFHGPTSAIEDRLAAKESEYGPLVDELRRGHFDISGVPLIVDFVLNLIIRTRNIRVGFAEMGAAMLDGFADAVRDPSNHTPVRQLIQAEILKNKRVRKTIRKRGGRRAMAQAERIVEHALSSLPIDPALLLRHLSDEARARVDTLAASRDAQLRILESDNALALRRKHLQIFHWSLEQRPPGTFILGDTGPTAVLEGCPDLENPVRPGMLRAIYLPVSTSILLVGRTGQFDQTIDPEALNRASVELSRDLFVANRDSARERRYLEVLGSRSALFRPSELDEGLREAFRLDKVEGSSAA